MAGREIKKGFVVSPFVAGLITTVVGVLLAASITISFAIYSGMSQRIEKQNEAHSKALLEQRDILIRLDQRLINKNENDQKEYERWEKRFQNAEAWQQVTNNEIAKLKEATK